MKTKKPKTILLVEDEAITAMAEARTLEKHGYTVLTALSGDKAIETSASHPEICLILMDIDLGSGMDGTQAAEAILKTRDIPVLFLSNHTEPEIVDKTEKITSYGYVVKNTGDTVLLASIRMAFKLHDAYRELRKREDDLTRNQKILSLIFDNTPNAITLTDAETNTVIEANTGMDWTGWTREEVVGKNPAMLINWIHPEKSNTIRKMIDETGKCINYRIEFFKKDGTVAHAIMNSILVQIDGRPHILTISNDVTKLSVSETLLRRMKDELEMTNEELNATVEELEATNQELQTTIVELKETKGDLESILAENKHTLQALQESEYFLRRSQEIARIGSFIWEAPQPGQSDYRWRSSQVMNDIMGIDETYPKTIESLMKLIVDPAAMMGHVNSQFEIKGNLELEYQIKRPSDGEIRWIYGLGESSFDDKGNFLSMLGTAQDITEHKRAEEIIMRERDFSRVVLDSMPGLFYMFDEQGKFIRWNRNFSAVSGYSDDEIAVRSPLDYFKEPERTLVAERITEAFKTGESSAEANFISKDGTEKPHYFTGKLMMFEGKPCLVGMGINITERKRAEETLIENESQLLNLLQHMRVGITIHAADSTIVFSNPEASVILGLSAEQMQGKAVIDPSWRFVREDGSTMPLEEYPVSRVLASLQPVSEFVVGVDRPAGDRSWGLVRAYPDFGPNQELKRIVATFVDITDRKRMEDALRESEEQYRNIINNMHDAFYQCDLDGNIVFTTSSSVRILGCSSVEEIIGLKVMDFYYSPKEAVTQYKNLKKEGKLTHYEATLKRRDTGEPVYVMVNSQFYHDRDGKIIGIQGVYIDITKRKQAEEKLRQEKIFTNAVFDSIPGLLYLYDDEGRLRRWNKNHETFTGYTADELYGMHVLDWFKHDPKDEATIKAGVEKALTEGYTTVEGTLMMKSGEMIPYYFTATLLEIQGRKYFTGIGIDISEQKKAEKALERTNELLRTVIDAAPTAIIGLDLEGLVQMVWNPAAEKMLGWSAEEVMGKYLPTVDVDKKEEFARFRDMIRSGKRLDGIDVQRRKKDGSSIDYSIYGSPLHDPEGNITGNIAVLVDISERKRAEEALGNALREKEALLQELQHRMKNSLAMITGIIELEAVRTNNPGVKTILNNLKGRIESLTNLYALLFQTNTVTEVSLEDYIHSIVSSLTASYMDSMGTIRIERQCDPLTVSVKNATAWGLIVNELLTNALKYAFPGERTGVIRILLKKANAVASLSVSDNGAGPPPDFSIDHPSGFGLLLVNMLTKQLGGAISFTRGTENVFTIRAPLQT